MFGGTPQKDVYRIPRFYRIDMLILKNLVNPVNDFL